MITRFNLRLHFLCFSLISGAILPSQASAQSAAPVQAATAITKIPRTITKPGTYVLKSDLVFGPATGSAIIVTAPDVTIDLGGHILSNSAALDGVNQSNGIESSGSGNLTVRNGSIRGFRQGIGSAKTGPSETLVEEVTVRNPTYAGFVVSGQTVEIRNCKVIGVGGNTNGIVFGMAVYGRTVKITRSTVLDMRRVQVGQQLNGIDARGDLGISLIENTIINDAKMVGDIGVSTSYFSDFTAGVSCFARGNHIANWTVGLKLGTASAGKYQDNLTVGCANPFIGGTAAGANN